MNDKLKIFKHAYISNYFLLKNVCKNKIILDIACGDGSGSAILASFEPQKVIAVDLNVQLINDAKETYQHENLEFFVANGEEIDRLFVDQKFDIIISNQTIEHLGDTKKFLTGLKNCLAANGILIISCSHHETRDESVLLRDYSTDQFIQEVTDILGKASRILESYPAFGVVNYDSKQITHEITNCYYSIPNIVENHKCLVYTLMYDENQLIDTNTYLDIVDLSAWNKIVSYDYLADIKKNRLIFELKQRALLAQALIIENEALREKSRSVRFTGKRFIKAVLEKVKSPFITALTKNKYAK